MLFISPSLQLPKKKKKKKIFILASFWLAYTSIPILCLSYSPFSNNTKGGVSNGNRYSNLDIFLLIILLHFIISLFIIQFTIKKVIFW